MVATVYGIVHYMCISVIRRCLMIKGYAVPEGYMGYVDGIYMLFATETDYREYVEEVL